MYHVKKIMISLVVLSSHQSCLRASMFNPFNWFRSKHIENLSDLQKAEGTQALHDANLREIHSRHRGMGFDIGSDAAKIIQKGVDKLHQGVREDASSVGGFIKDGAKVVAPYVVAAIVSNGAPVILQAAVVTAQGADELFQRMKPTPERISREQAQIDAYKAQSEKSKAASKQYQADGEAYDAAGERYKRQGDLLRCEKALIDCFDKEESDCGKEARRLAALGGAREANRIIRVAQAYGQPTGPLFPVEEAPGLG